jgi:hypothetical protein
MHLVGLIIRIPNHHAVCHNSMISCSQVMNESHSQFMLSDSGMALPCETVKSNTVDESLMRVKIAN